MSTMPTPTPHADGPLESVRFHGLKAGPKLLVLGGVHGNEGCGPAAIGRIIAECRSGAINIKRGTVTFLPIANPKARRQNTRIGDRNLNRNLCERALPSDNEDRIGNPLTAVLREHEVLLDVHSFTEGREPFVFFGPDNNDGDLEPFRHAKAEQAFAASLGTDLLIHGWLDIYAAQIEACERLDLPRLPVTEGIGTTEYMRSVGGYAVTLECGQHDDPASIEVGYVAIRNALSHLGLIDDAPLTRVTPRVIQMKQLVMCEKEADKVEGDWTTGDMVKAGQAVARRADGTLVAAERDLMAIFPHRKAKPGEPLMYLGEPSPRQA